MKHRCIILTGPTAVGKTRLSIRLAKALNGSIISADSMQVYRHMNIGTAKITQEEMQGIPHYLVDCIEPEAGFNVALFQEMANEAIVEIEVKGRLPIIVGGTGFYIQALLKQVDFSESEGESPLREKLLQDANTYGPEYLHHQLAACDPISADVIHPNNIKRVIRALEFFHQTGEPISLHNLRAQEKQSPFIYAYFVLNDARPRLYERIDRRVDQMIADGLEDEVRQLQSRGLTSEYISMKGLGYREWFPYFEGECTKEEVIEAIKQNTRHFAKRQLTWFRREKDICWIERMAFEQDEDQMLAYMLEYWAEIERSGELQSGS